MNNLSDMFGNFNKENLRSEFAAIQMEALSNADQRDMNINAEKEKKKNTFTDATGEAIEMSSMELENFDALAEEAMGPEFSEFAFEAEDVDAQFEANEKNKKASNNKVATEGKGACTCGECEECLARKKATEEYNFGTEEDTSLEAMIAAIPESSIEECVESFRALDDTMDGTTTQQYAREALSAQLDLLIPSYN